MDRPQKLTGNGTQGVLLCVCFAASLLTGCSREYPSHKLQDNIEGVVQCKEEDFYCEPYQFFEELPEKDSLYLDYIEENQFSVPLNIKLPFPKGECHKVIRGNFGPNIHYDYNNFAWDFSMPTGSEIVAVADGIVVGLYENFTLAGDVNEFWNFENHTNYIILDHGKGVFSNYLHVDYNGVLVEVGDLVSAGEVIALSGNTGYLHFMLSNVVGFSLPARFVDFTASCNGIPKKDDIVKSGNDGSGTTPFMGESNMPWNTFLNPSIDVVIDSLIPARPWRPGTEYFVKGHVVNLIGQATDSLVVDFIIGPMKQGQAIQFYQFRLGEKGAFAGTIKWTKTDGADQLSSKSWRVALVVAVHEESSKEFSGQWQPITLLSPEW